MTRITSLFALSAALILSAGGLLATTAFASPASPGDVVVNEFVSNPTSGNEWIELYNKTGSSVDLSGWTLEDGASTPHTISLTGSIASHGFATFEYSSSELNNGGDTITLLDSASTTIDSVAYGSATGSVVSAPGAGQSAYRSPDGSSNWAITSTPTKNTANTPVEDVTSHTFFQTIQAAVDAATAGDTIKLNSGTTTENVTISTPVTLEGTTGSALVGQITVAADNVTIDHMTITNPSGGYGIVSTDHSNLSIKNNYLYDIGTTLASGSAQAIYVKSGSADVSNVTITHNRIENIGNTNLVHGSSGSAKGIFIGDSNGSHDFNGVTITHNAINGVYASAATWPAGRGAYGILVNHTTGTHATNGLDMEYNTVKNLDGLWAHAFAIEGNTPGAKLVENNAYDLTSHKTPSDALPISWDGNTSFSSVYFHRNWLNAHLVNMGSTTIDVNAAFAGDPVGTLVQVDRLSHQYFYVGVNAFATIQAGLDAVAPGGTVHVENGSYNTDLTFTKDGVKLIGVGRKGVQVTSDGSQSYGMFLDKVKNVTIKYLTFTVSPSDAKMNYALHADQADGLSLRNVAFKGVVENANGKKVGGVDLNTTSNVTLDGVTADGFGKNGFSFLSIYSNGETSANNVTFNNTQAMHNGWAGYAFYTVGDDHSPTSTGPGASITGVHFTGKDYAYFNGAQGVFLEGDSDANYGANNTPAYTVTTDGKTLDLSHVVFKDNGVYDIDNYQTAGVNAIGAKFNGITGDAMTAAQIAAEDQLIHDHLDLAALGLVRYHAPVAPSNLHFLDNKGNTIACGSTVKSVYDNKVQLVWTDPLHTHRTLITYPNGTTTTAWTGSHNLWIGDRTADGYKDNGFANKGQGVYTYQVQAQDASGVWSDWSAPCTIAYDTKSPTAHFDPTPSEYVNGNFPVSGVANDNVALKGVFFDVRDPNAPAGTNSWVAGCVNGTASTTFLAASTTALTSCTINTSKLTEGKQYTLRIHAGDYAGYGGGQQQTLILDTTRPNGSITAPADGSTLSGNFQITGTATDTLSGVDHVDIYVTKLTSTGGFGGYAVKAQPATWDPTTNTFSYQVSGLADGKYTIKANVFDKAGNNHFVGPSPTITVQNVVAAKVTTDSATAVGPFGATLNGTNGPVAASNTSFWWGTTAAGPFTASAHPASQLPSSGWSHDSGLGAVAANASFSAPLTSLAPNTTYYFVAWSQVGGVWYPGNVLTFTTSSVVATCPVGTIRSASPIETVNVNSSSDVPTASVSNLASGMKYLLVASGTWQNGSTKTADAEYVTTDGWATHTDGPAGLNPDRLDLQVGGNFVNWGSYSPAHTYSYLYTGTGTPVSLMVFDGDASTNTPNPSWYGDNNGSLSVAVYACQAQVTTNDATSVALTSATLNGTNGTTPADNTSFWWGTTAAGPFTPSATPASQFPASGWSRDSGLGAVMASAPFSESLTGLTASTTYHFVAWSHIGGVWYPGTVKSFTTGHESYTYATTTVRATNLVTDLTSNPTGWAFWNDTTNAIDNTLGSFVTGPGTAPVGTGSAQISAAAGARPALLTGALAGTALKNITTLSYATYRATGTPALDFSLQFDINKDGTSAPASYEGRLVYEPYFTHTVLDKTWQTWNTLDNATSSGHGNWWFSNGNLANQSGCSQASPCTWDEILQKYPNIGISGGTYLKAGAWSSDFSGNVDDFVVGVKSGTSVNQVTYDFEPAVTSTPTTPTTPSGGGGGSHHTGLLGDLNHDGKVNFADYAIFMAQMHKHGAALSADLNDDFVVNMKDLAILLGNWTG